MTLENQALIPSIDLLLTMEREKKRESERKKKANSSSSFWLCCLATHPQDNTAQMGDTGGDLVEHSPLGHVSIITGLEAVMHQNTKHVLQGRLLTDDQGKVVERLQWHLI